MGVNRGTGLNWAEMARRAVFRRGPISRYTTDNSDARLLAAWALHTREPASLVRRRQTSRLRAKSTSTYSLRVIKLCCVAATRS